ncbi:MAG: DUF1385 domain-containing protein [Ruminococcaceae bacterium]|nr:DUF1385 domain-containing protein [Oscillospiraceae bacterium]
MKDKKTDNSNACRLGKVGGQAVLEGVMMKCGDRTALAVRDESGEIRLDAEKYESLRKKHKVLRIPLIRGVVNFIESMMLSYKTLMKSADMLGLDEVDEESKAEKWLRSKMGDKFLTVLMSIASVLGVALAMVLFMFLPSLVTSWIDSLAGGLGWFRNLIEGVMKIGIFVAYICLCSLMKEMRRVFEYHGAEHKSIACYEAGLELTPANAKTCTRFHPRCGTSFIFVILILSILINSLLTWDNLIFRVGGKLLLLPLIVGLGFEFIMYAGKHVNPLTKILSAPGLWMQRVTTREPDESQLEVAIAALKFAMPDEFPHEEENAEASQPEDEDKADVQ